LAYVGVGKRDRRYDRIYIAHEGALLRRLQRRAGGAGEVATKAI